MTISKDSKVQNFINDLELSSESFHAQLQRIRSIFFQIDENLNEEMKYGGILFGKNATHFGGIFVYKGHLSIEFSEGASLPNTENILEGSGKQRRHIKIFNLEDIQMKKVAYFIELAYKNTEA
jgi:hypothetical protein